MILASIDPTSQAYAAGEVIGYMLPAATGIGVLWWLTRSWRKESASPVSDPARAARGKRKRTWFIAGVSVCIAAAASVTAFAAYDPEPRAGETRAADGTEEYPVIVLPELFDRFRLLKGEDAARAESEALAGRKLPHSLRTGYYDQDADGSSDLLVLVNSADWDPKVAESKATKSISQEFRNYFAGAKARDVTRFDAGRHGGGLACGHVTGPDGDQTMCAWSDAANFVGVRHVRETDLATAARTTLALRDAATG
ncbi:MULTISPECIES: hypothetical protein [Streptomyces]|uniref:Secreted protein n=1 Tax=Streptomyces amritsarensis TaxID=681158 RepID=A0ABX3G8R9_9ACTN|nr:MULTISPECIES: hypothetical protein [Streptomyces]AQT70931.1 hypothetical protein B1K54_03720 [Streptomyces sp. fd1-xmd]OLZ72321.1 hypothetical protein AVW11_04275 [Streptomyces amritsarensis]